MTGCSGPNIAPEAMRNRSEYPICPAAPVIAIRRGALLINFSEGYTFDRCLKEFVNKFPDFFLGKIFNRRKKESFFETAEICFRKYHGQMSGNPV
jgi:hypothetical protein